MVYNGTSCGLNEVVWAPNFWLPTAKSMTRVLGYSYKSVDLDLGEMFLNFPLHPSLQAYSGVDLTPFKRQLDAHLPDLKWYHPDKRFVTWTRDWMGFKPSPEWACRYYYLAEEFVRGNEQEPLNPLRWDRVILNTIGSKEYDPALPNVFKLNKLTNRIAGDIKAYVDDLRAIGHSYEHAWSIARYLASRLQYLGIQDAGRKRRIDNGPWAGSIFITTEKEVLKTVTPEKWKKGRDYIWKLALAIKEDPEGSLDFKLLEKVRGYLCHLAMTYEIIFPYLKGFHLTLCTHLPNRDEEGWKISDLEWIGRMEQLVSEGKMSEVEKVEMMNKIYDPKDRPTQVKPVKRFYTCLKALKRLFKEETPPIVVERSTNINLLIYGG